MLKNFFIDLGTHMGAGILDFINKYKMSSDTWEIHTFEPHPLIFELGGKNDNNYYNEPPHSFSSLNEALVRIPTIERHNAAASICDGETPFFIEWNLNQLKMGSSIIKEVADFNQKDFTGEYVNVKTVDIFKFIKEKTDQNIFDNLIIKMDIEGAEFEVLNYFIKNMENKNTFKANNIEIYCEFHHRLFSRSHNTHPSIESYKNNFLQKQITLHEWH